MTINHHQSTPQRRLLAYLRGKRDGATDATSARRRTLAWHAKATWPPTTLLYAYSAGYRSGWLATGR